MGCFLGCFGSSKDQKRRKKRNKVQPRDQRNASSNLVQSAVSSVQVESEKPITSVSEVRDKPEEQSNSSPRKKVTFDTNVTAYEPVSTNEDSDVLQECEEFGKNKKKEYLAKFSPTKCSSEDSSVTSSLGSYPSNHRYQNCRDSDDEELDIEDSDLDEDEDEDDFYDDDGELEYEDGIVESKRGIDDKANNALQTVCDLPEREVIQTGLNCNARDRSGYVHSVLNPVENLTQWRAVKAKGAATSVKPRKENSTLDLEPRISFSSNPSFKVDQSKQEIAVDASLSNWLVVSSEATSVKKTTSIFGLDSTPETVTSQGLNSIKSKEDRPILGALTVEELRQFSASSSSPRKSPRRSPDEMPIIGTVGTHWIHEGSATNFDSASFKGIPNTTSKYREVYVK